MAKIVVSGDTSGAITLESPSVAGTNTINLPAATGTAVLTGVSGTVDINAAGSNNVTLSTNSTERVRVDSSGNALIGTTTADNRLTVSNSSNGAATGVISLVNPNDGTNTAADLDFVTHSSGTLATGRIRGLVAGADNYPMSFWTYSAGGLAERMRITSGGDLLVGTTSTYDNSKTSFARADTTTTGLVLNLYNSASTSTTKANAANRILRIASNASGADTHINFTDSVTNNYLFGGNNGGAYVVANTNGVRLANGGTSWASDSDERIKDIIEPITDAANKVAQLRSVIGKYKTDEEGTRRPFLIAQDVQAVLPEAVFDEQGTLMLAYTDTIPLLVAAIKELKAELDTVKAEVQALKGVK